MRVRHFVLMASAGLVAIGFAAQGCGGSSESNPASADAGQDVALDTTPAPKDTGAPDVQPDTAVDCPDADLKNPNLPDASLADGATSVGECLSCVESKCGAQVDMCNADCDCKAPIVELLTCVSTGQPLLQCGEPLIAGGSNTNDNAQQLGLCVYGKCLNACAPNFDAGAKDAGAQDAPSDGG